MQLCNWLRRTW